MQSLRDKLLKSGLVDKKSARKSKTEARRQKKKRGGAGKVDAEQDQRRQQDYTERTASEARVAQREAAQVNAARERREREERRRNIIERHCLVKIDGDQRCFHFVAPDRKIQRLMTTDRVAERLVAGEVAIVSAPYDARRSYRLVEREIAERLEQLAPSCLLFWNRDPAGDDERGPTYGATGPATAAAEPTS